MTRAKPTRDAGFEWFEGDEPTAPPTVATTFYRLVSDWAGVPWSRASSPIKSFGDANEEAMRVGYERRVRVYAITPGQGNDLGTLVAEYHPSASGRPICISDNLATLAPVPVQPSPLTVALSWGVVAAKLYKGRAVALTYANVTQASKKAADLGAGWVVCGRRPYFVRREVTS